MDKLILGIDFGTSTNFVTKYDFNRKDAVAVDNMGGYTSSNIFDNCIFIENENNFVLGETAKNKMHSSPENYFEDIKRFIIDDKKSYRIPNLGNKEVTPIDIATMIFKTIKKKVEENYGGQEIDGVVVTVPYSYSKKYRERIKQIVESAGIHVIKLVEEPVAAAISYGLFSKDIQTNKKEKIAVFDLGGGTFDITIFNFEKKDEQTARIEVLNTDGVEKLGGKTIDELLAKKFMNELGVEYTDFTKEKERIKFQTELQQATKRYKEELSNQEEIDIYDTFTINSKLKELEIDEFSRDDFNEILKNNNILGQIEDALDRAIYDIDLEPSDIDRVVLAGGSSNIPIIKELVEDFFGITTESKKNLGELVGHGAGILAGLAYDNNLNYEVIRKTSKNIGIAKGNTFKPILFKNTKYGEQSALYPLKLVNKDETELIVNFYESDVKRIDNENCEKIGKVIIDGTKFPTNTIYISLEREDEKESKLRVRFFDDKKQLVEDEYLEDA